MPELPELEALRIRLAPRLENKLITAATVNPKKAHMLRYPVEHFAHELPGRRIVSLIRRGKHLVFGTELGSGGTERWLVMYSFGERRGLLGNGPLAWTLAVLDGIVGQPNDYYKLYLSARMNQNDQQVGLDVADLARTLFPRVATWYAA